MPEVKAPRVERGTMTDHEPAAKVRSLDNPEVGVVRETVDLVVVLCLGVLMFRTFSAEAYVVPTGSMAADADWGIIAS